jgi:hypothetical protein
MAHIDPTLMQHVFDIAQSKRKSNIHHHRQADDFGTGFEITERVGVGNAGSLGSPCTGLKQLSSDSAVATDVRFGNLHFTNKFG